MNLPAQVLPSSLNLNAQASSLGGVSIGAPRNQDMALTEEASKLAGLLREVSDRSSLSPELIKRAIELNLWYHITPFRSSLIRSLEIPQGARLLEVGCGGGALTRYLGECGFQVVGIETSAELAECARLRCEDLSNVEVVHGFFEDVVSDQRFDFVICIDPVFPESDFLDPGIQLFALSRKVLKATGTLVLSVGNSLFSPGGAHVESTRKYVKGSAAPLEALSRSLEGVGFARMEHYAAFPHHAAPQLLVDVEGARVDRVAWLPLINDLFATSDQAKREFESWWRGVALEGLEAKLAPGWLILAHAHSVHSVLWSGASARYFVPGKVEDVGVGVQVCPFEIVENDLIRTILRASKPNTYSIKEYKESLVAADQRIDKLLTNESVLNSQLSGVREELVVTQEKHAKEIVGERESRRIREAELALVLRQYHSVGAMCHDMRQEGRKLKDMLDELKRRYVASEDWGAALSKRIAEAEAELQQAKSSRSYRVAQMIKGFLFGRKNPSLTSAVKASLRSEDRENAGII